jgi:hypothetical protein
VDQGIKVIDLEHLSWDLCVYSINCNNVINESGNVNMIVCSGWFMTCFSSYI